MPEPTKRAFVEDLSDQEFRAAVWEWLDRLEHRANRVALQGDRLEERVRAVEKKVQDDEK